MSTLCPSFGAALAFCELLLFSPSARGMRRTQYGSGMRVLNEINSELPQDHLGWSGVLGFQKVLTRVQSRLKRLGVLATKRALNT